MGPVVQSLAALPDSDIQAIATYFGDLIRPVSARPEALTAEVLARSRDRETGAPNDRGRQLYYAACAGCHDDGGSTPLATRMELMLNSAVWYPRPNNFVLAVLDGVGSNPTDAPGPLMPPFRNCAERRADRGHRRLPAARPPAADAVAALALQRRSHARQPAPGAQAEGQAQMKRREIMASIAVAPFLPAVARAQTAGRQYRIAWVTGTPITDPTTVTVLDVLRNSGFVQGKNLTVDPRGLSLRPDQMMAVARQIAEDKVDLFLTGGSAGTRAAQAATSTIPILAITDDMVGEGLVESLANRRGNTTGISVLSADLDGKRQELLIELLPKTKKMAMLTDGTNTKVALLQARAKESGVDMSVLPISKPDDIEPALKKAKVDGVTAINILGGAILFAMRPKIFDTATALGLATMYQWPEGVREGALAAYGPSLMEMFRQRGRQALKLLRGTRPSDMPIEQPTVVKLALNLKLAAQLGITVPPAFLQRADETIE